uniref:Recep_L_domain domain-containing protein n=1 Tax=Caenorhabditis tropicalis TaxID=1561998 RepID=A0A1I7U035_9PELO
MSAKRDGLYLTIRNNPKLCVTPQDLGLLYDGLSLDSNLDIKICYDADTPANWCQIPESGYHTDLPDGCIRVIGNLLFDDKFDFANSYKLYDIEVIYGSLTVTNSTLRTFNMFPNLIKVITTKDDAIPVHIYNNTMLAESFVSFTFKGAESGVPVTITNNPNLEVYDMMCSYLKTRKKAVVEKNRLNCGDYDSLPKRKYDRTPLNIDVYKGVPPFAQVSHLPGGGDDSGTLNNPWDRNTTDTDYYEEEVVATTTENGCSNGFAFTIIIFCIQFILLF